MGTVRRDQEPSETLGGFGPNEFIIRRLSATRPNSPPTTIMRQNEGLTATSIALSPRRGETHPSWSRLETTSPQKLIHLEAMAGRDVTGWLVCAVRVADVRSLGLEVVADPTDDDPGHCLIVPTELQPFTKTIWSKLAKKALVIYTREADAAD